MKKRNFHQGNEDSASTTHLFTKVFKLHPPLNMMTFYIKLGQQVFS